VCMSLSDLDTSRPIRTYAGRVALVEAILQSHPAFVETDWLEWKSEYDLTNSEQQGHLGRHVLGMANRHPDHSALVAGGCGYIVCGVERGSVRGVKPVDSAVLSATIPQYLGGANGPQWDATFVEVRDAPVLVITVEPPKWGDPIYPLRKQFAKYLSGTIFVRRAGETHQADAPEHEMLSQRLLRRTSTISVDVNWQDQPEILCVGLDNDDLEKWIDQEGADLLAPLDASLNPLGIGLLGIMEGIGESRKPAEYRKAVEDYLHAARKEAGGRLLAEGILKSQYLRLTITNHTDLNFARVRCEVHIPGPVVGALRKEDATDYMESFPARPRKYGEPRDLFSGLSNLSFGPPNVDFPRASVKNRASADFIFDEIDVRPRSRVRLEKFILIAVAEVPEGMVEATWKATSTSVDGVAEGRLVLPVPAVRLSLSDLLNKSEPASG
jgi:hypothetical protein